MIMKKGTFKKILFVHKDFVISHLCHFIMILSNLIEILRIFIFLRENIYLPSMRFLYRKSLFKNVLTRTLFLYPRHLCRRVYSFRFSVCPFVCSYVR